MSRKMLFKVTAVLFAVLVTASALPRSYHEWPQSYHWKSHATDMAARAHIQAAEVDKSACVVVTERRNGIAFPVRVCAAEEEG